MSDNKILEEYYQIFGKKQYDNLYDLDDESYQALRQEILNTPPVKCDKDRLPFSGITINHKPRSVIYRPKETQIDIFEILSDHEKKKKICNIVEDLLINKISSISPIFYIKEKGIIMARGYYDSHRKCFHILQKSIVALNESSDYSGKESSKKRQRFLDAVCKREGFYYRVIKDAPCISAKTAADYILGKDANQDCWITNKGISFGKYMESLSLSSKNSPVEHQNDLHLFYINREPKTGEFRKGIGYFQPKQNSFVIKQKSILIFDPKSDNATSRYVLDNCIHISGIFYMLKKDMTFSSPSAAAALCIGRKTNGWMVWVDKKGKTLKDFYGNK